MSQRPEYDRFRYLAGTPQPEPPRRPREEPPVETALTAGGIRVTYGGNKRNKRKRAA